MSTKPLLWGTAEGCSLSVPDADWCSRKDRGLLCLQHRKMGRSTWQTSAKNAHTLARVRTGLPFVTSKAESATDYETEARVLKASARALATLFSGA